MNDRAPGASNPAVAIILVNWNGWRDSVECIDSVLAQRHDNFHIFLVDNNSSDRSIEQIAAWCADPRAELNWRTHEGVDRWTGRASAQPVAYRLADTIRGVLEPPPKGCRLTLVRSGDNRGFAAGCNVGIRAAGLEGFDFFWFLNGDTVVHRDALSALVARALREPRTGMTGSTLLFYGNPALVQAFGGGCIDPRTGAGRTLGAKCRATTIPRDGAAVEKEMSYAYGASMLVCRAFISEVGLMQEDYFLYYEEADWALRGRGRFSLGYAPDSHVFHKSGASSGKVLPLFSFRHYYRNRIRFICRFYPEHLHSARRDLLWEGLRYLLRGRLAKARIIATIVREASQMAAQMRDEVVRA